MDTKSTWVFSVILVASLAGLASAGTISIPLVTVGDPGNVADPATGYGSVPYTYSIGEYDVTIGDYTAFLNAVAVNGDPFGLYNPAMAPGNGPAYGFRTLGIAQWQFRQLQLLSGGQLQSGGQLPDLRCLLGRCCAVRELAGKRPADRARKDRDTTETGTYTLNGGTSNLALMQVSRNPGSTWVLPTVNEWYKAAYYVGGGTNAGYWTYPTQSNTPPSNVLSSSGTNNANFTDVNKPGRQWRSTDHTNFLTPVGAFAASPGPYGTYDMGGDVWQWNETSYYNHARGLRGGSFAGDVSILLSGFEDNIAPIAYDPDVGFRVAYVPEPSSIELLTVAVAVIAILYRNRSCHRK